MNVDVTIKTEVLFAFWTSNTWGGNVACNRNQFHKRLKSRCSNIRFKFKVTHFKCVVEITPTKLAKDASL